MCPLQRRATAHAAGDCKQERPVKDGCSQAKCWGPHSHAPVTLHCVPRQESTHTHLTGGSTLPAQALYVAHMGTQDNCRGLACRPLPPSCHSYGLLLPLHVLACECVCHSTMESVPFSCFCRTPWIQLWPSGLCGKCLPTEPSC